MRKKLNEKNALKYDIKLRVNQWHYDRLSGMLSQSHYKNMSELLRDIVCERQVVIYTRDETLGMVMEELAGIRKELNSIGININQAVKRLHNTVEKSKTLLLGLEIAEHLQQLERLTQQLFPIISQLAKKWLQ